MALVDLPAFGRPTVKHAWHKRRWRCPRGGCGAGSATEQAVEIALARALLTARAARWATRQAGRGRPLKDVAAELGCVWHTVNSAVRRWGAALLDADTERISRVSALGLDEHLMMRRGRFRTKAWGTSIVDVGRGQLLDIVRGRTAKAPTRWLLGRPRGRRAGIRWAVLDLSGPYRAAFNAAVPKARQVADPFHVVRLGNDALDDVRRRVQNQTLGHRGRKDDPLYRARKLLVSASENITEAGRNRLRGLLDAGDPYGEVRDAWHAKETLRAIYDIADHQLGIETVNQLAADLQDPGQPEEINRLGRTMGSSTPMFGQVSRGALAPDLGHSPFKGARFPTGRNSVCPSRDSARGEVLVFRRVSQARRVSAAGLERQPGPDLPSGRDRSSGRSHSD